MAKSFGEYRIAGGINGVKMDMYNYFKKYY